MTHFANTTPLVHEPESHSPRILGNPEAIEAARSILSAQAFTEGGASPMPRIPRDRIPGAGVVVVPVCFALIVIAICFAAHLLMR